MAAAVPKIRWRVAAIGKDSPSWCIPLPVESSVGDLQRAVEIRENMRREEAGEAGIVVGIQLRLDGDQCAVHPSDLLLDLVPEGSKDAMLVAIRKGGRDAVATPPPLSLAAVAASATASAAGPGLVEATREISHKPTAELPPFMEFVFPCVSATSCKNAPGAAGVGQGRAGIGSASSNTGLLAGTKGGATRKGAPESDRTTVGSLAVYHAPFSQKKSLVVSSAVSAVSVEAAPPAPAPSNRRFVDPLVLLPVTPSTDSHQQHAHQPSVNNTSGRQETAGAGCRGARVAATPGASAAVTAGAAFLIPSAPFRPPERPTSLESSSKRRESPIPSSIPFPASVASKPATATEISGVDGNDAETDVTCLGSSNDASPSTARFSPPPSKKARVHLGHNLQLLPRAANTSQHKAAETIVLVAAMLYAGTANQQKEAQAFVEADLSMHDKEVSEGLIEKLKGTVKIDEGDVWVGKKDLLDLCKSYQNPLGFCSVTKYLLGRDPRKKMIQRKVAKKCFDKLEQKVKLEAGGPFEVWKKDGKNLFKWLQAQT